MSNKRKAEMLVDSDDVGGCGTLSENHTISCRFHNFAKLPHKRGDSIYSRVLKCHGHEWKIELFPGGHIDSDEEDIHVSMFLLLMTEITDGLRVKYCIRAGPKRKGAIDTFKSSDHSWGYPNYTLRGNVLRSSKGFLDDEGALEIKVDIQIYTARTPAWRPKKQLLQLDMLKLLDSAKNADVIFSVGDKKFSAHSYILELRAPTLASMAEDANGTEVEISNVQPHVFHQFLRYVYGDELPSSSNMKGAARELLESSDRFGCSGMKLQVESEVVDSILSADNAADWVLFADSHSCALLKEAAISLFASNSKSVMASSGWEALKESAELMSELMQALVTDPGAKQDENDTTTMSVSMLREQLEEKGLDVDGTREMLVERLKEAKSKSGKKKKNKRGKKNVVITVEDASDSN